MKTLLPVPFLVLTALASPVTIHVSPSGSDASPDPTDPATPYATLGAAIAASARFDQIRLSAGTYQEVGLEIDHTLAIIGDGPEETVIRGAESPGLAGGRIFHIGAGYHVTLDGMTISNGVAPAGSGGGSGGGVFNAGSDLNLTNVVLKDNRSATGAGGGGLWHDGGELVISSSLITLNHAGTDGDGGGIYLESGNALITTSSVHDNHAGDEAAGMAGDGGGIYISDGFGQVMIEHSRICDNRAGDGLAGSGGRGGGVFNHAALEIQTSLISGNGSGGSTGANGGDGGAIFHLGGMLDLSNSTLSGNFTGPSGPSSGAGGSGSALDATQAAGPADLRFNTITDNHTGTGFFFGGYGAIHANTSQTKIRLKGNIIFGNTVPPSGGGPDLAGDGILSQGHNIIGGDGGFNIANPSLGDMPGVDPLLLPLADNGGATMTFLPGPGSPAIGIVPLLSARPGDQRGFFRGDPTAIGAADPGAQPPLASDPPRVELQILPRLDESGVLRLLITPTQTDQLYTPMALDSSTLLIDSALSVGSPTRGAGVPMISDIPLVGSMFRSGTERKDRAFVIIAVTPRIIENEDP